MEENIKFYEHAKLMLKMANDPETKTTPEKKKKAELELKCYKHKYKTEQPKGALGKIQKKVLKTRQKAKDRKSFSNTKLGNYTKKKLKSMSQALAPGDMAKVAAQATGDFLAAAASVVGGGTNKNRRKKKRTRRRR